MENKDYLSLGSPVKYFSFELGKRTLFPMFHILQNYEVFRENRQFTLSGDIC